MPRSAAVKTHRRVVGAVLLAVLLESALRGCEPWLLELLGELLSRQLRELPVREEGGRESAVLHAATAIGVVPPPRSPWTPHLTATAAVGFGLGSLCPSFRLFDPTPVF